MANVWTTRIRALPWGMKELGRALRARLRGEPSLRESALQFVQAQATRGDPESVLRTLDRFARERRFLMNVGDEKGPLLEETVRAVGPAARILELGSFVGYSAILMARHLAVGGCVTSIDINETSSRVSREMAEFAGVADRTQFLTGKSSERIGGLSEPFDIVFLDHWKSLYLSDTQMILERRLLRPDAVVIADNVGPFFGENDYVAWMQNHPDFDSEYKEARVEYQNIEDGVLVSRWTRQVAAD
ncbi:MAG: class I SAM-dependent methyltransferase [Deltaproteobacteria bacterium]|nr:class I SAM-dependent methyltransferase [Deltaproteobacteria bacterium]